MPHRPGRTFVLIRLGDGQERDTILGRFPVEDDWPASKVNLLEAMIRRRYRVDDPDSGLALRDTALDDGPW
jgi:hypothetical protein